MEAAPQSFRCVDFAPQCSAVQAAYFLVVFVGYGSNPTSIAAVTDVGLATAPAREPEPDFLEPEDVVGLPSKEVEETGG